MFAAPTSCDNEVGMQIFVGRHSRAARPGLDFVRGCALSAQAGEAQLREVITAGGFCSVRRAAETPFNMILEARP